MGPFTILIAGIGVVLVCIIVFRLHAFLSLVLAALVVGMLTSPETLYDFGINNGMLEAEAKTFSTQLLGKRLAIAFGNTCGKIGILIAMASVIGVSLLKSGAAERLVRSLMNLFGKKNTSFAFLTGTFTLVHQARNIAPLILVPAKGR